MSRPDPGPELDALVAERVMGWEQIPHPDHLHGNPGTFYRPGTGQYGVYREPGGPWSPSTDIRAAWEVVDRITSTPYDCDDGIRLPWDFELWNCPDHCWKAAFWRDWHEDKPVAWACDTAPHAICLAALKAMEARDVDS